ncbi:ABC-2 family transporter protein [Vibrio mimicus]
MLRNIKLVLYLVNQYLKTLMFYRLDFYVGIVGFIFSQITSIAFLLMASVYVKSIGGWTVHEILLLYGVFQIPRGIDHLLTDNLWKISMYLKEGQFDKFLIRPANPLLQLLSERFQPDAIGELVLGILMVYVSYSYLELEVSLVSWMCFGIAVFFGAILYFSIKLFMATLSFFILDASSVMNFAYQLSEVTKQPLPIYSEPIKFFFMYIIPFAYTSYFPALILLDESSSIVTTLNIVSISCLFFAISYRFWCFGLSKYTSSGS